jgi:acyl transferase domain-containing protein
LSSELLILPCTLRTSKAIVPEWISSSRLTGRIIGDLPGPAIPFDALGLKLAVALEPTPAGTGPALAAVNSFGYGGTNAHALLQEAPCRQAGDAAAPEQRPGPYVLPISARGGGALKAMTEAYAARLETLPGDALPDFCQTAAVHRSHHDSRPRRSPATTRCGA